MIQRCTNPNNAQFHDYGGRAITVCERWRKFANFLEDMGQPPDGLTLERVDNERGYCKENCIWASRKTQQRNRRVNRLIEVNGDSKCVSEWAEIRGITEAAIHSRLRAGWSAEQVLGLQAAPPQPSRLGSISAAAHLVEFEGRSMTLMAWSRELGLNNKTVHSRLARGASDLEALGLVHYAKNRAG